MDRRSRLISAILHLRLEKMRPERSVKMGTIVDYRTIHIFSQEVCRLSGDVSIQKDGVRC